MASATDTGKSKDKGGKRFRLSWGSRRRRTIIALNVLGLVILIGGALILNETRRALVEANLDTLTAEAGCAATISEDMAEGAALGSIRVVPAFAGDGGVSPAARALL